MLVNYDDDVILLTCASGKQCSKLIPLLYNKWKQLRLAVNSAASEECLKAMYPNATVVRADMARIDDARRLLSGVTSILYIGPSIHSHETEIGYNMIDAARNEFEHGNLKHFVYSSVLHPQLRKLPNHDCKRYVEEYLIESGLNYTIIQPSHILDQFSVDKVLQSREPVLPVNFDPQVTFSFTALQDLAEAFACILEERGRHYLAQYTACSTRPTSYADIARMLGEQIGKSIEIKQEDYFTAANWFQNMFRAKNGDVPPATRDAIHRLLLYYNFYGIKGNPNVLAWLIKREPTTIKDFLHQRVSEFWASK
ncbi:NAD(P)-binding protein [Aspergillus eucalypticola CBS 122712]|uniref:NAD(P)-binding protein n=1 Tax=Aspergillus eucalypticola (strain CBS 122712 / IBT 29274) TaxID=1448314 RepID=A0A317UY17_ASPEC|nr:NAD(P)-binding protein [Aspergillus eucalypticola CBS 122712]PWY65407.1 NAD(P)-binding protein [Aspergillus eucalypticola CBS 122712]